MWRKVWQGQQRYERSGLYVKDEIIVGTIYFGLTPDAFRDDNDNYNNWFQKIAFDFNAEDDNGIVVVVSCTDFEKKVASPRTDHDFGFDC